ncbi:MAG TPA: putative toxin-antitoxin system toxin component, PIN family [Spirochaetota bacterium]|nr:putative toxin-antitoxin system toxin component, PIN family [Spirochaetota bacterium]
MKSNKLKIILDTNILLVSLSKTSKYHWIFEKLNNEEFDLFISNDVLSEYEEIIEKKTNNQIAQKTIRYLLTLPNVYLVNPYFNWILIENDPDDNKFVDCAVAGNVDYIITNDKHFDILKTLDFPKIVTLKIDEFKTLFE